MALHYAAASGAITSFTDRVFYTDLQSGKQSFYLKPADAIVSVRRAGTTVTFDQLNKYFTISKMPIIASRYWNMVHGAKPEDVEKDCGRLADNAHSCKEHGMVPKMQGGWHEGWRAVPQERRKHLH